jgi:hypothetical protein
MLSSPFPMASNKTSLNDPHDGRTRAWYARKKSKIGEVFLITDGRLILLAFRKEKFCHARGEYNEKTHCQHMDDS